MVDRLLYSRIASDAPIDACEHRAALAAILDAQPRTPDAVLIVPPDITRASAGAGPLTRAAVALLHERNPRCRIVILPALGTHAPMTPRERETLFGDLPAELFAVHNWRTDLTHLGDVPASFIHEVSQGQLEYPIKVEINAQLTHGNFDLILSIGQVVPHEVAGMANGSKNILVGVGGQDTINKTHFLGAVCNMERIMGRAQNPVRSVFDYAAAHFFGALPLAYVQTVMAVDAAGAVQMRGLFAGVGAAPFRAAAALSQSLNITTLDTPLRKVLVHLHPHEFKSTWLGNKAIYRTRMAMADDGELIILAPGIETFGEDREIDRLIRRYGYRGTPATLDAVRAQAELRQNLSAAAHLIHGSSEGRFRITYAPGALSRQEIESVGFAFGDLAALERTYQPATLRDGPNVVNGDEFFYISNPALGLWARRSQFA